MSNCRTWCPGNPDCDDPKMLCQDLVDDYHAFQVKIKCEMMKYKTVSHLYLNFPFLGACEGISGQIHVSAILLR